MAKKIINKKEKTEEIKSNQSKTTKNKNKRENKKLTESSKLDEKIIGDKEEIKILEDIKEKYVSSIKEVEKTIFPLIDNNLLKKAIKCLKKIILSKYKDKTNILSSEEDEFFYINLVFDRLPSKFSVRPVNITIPNQIYGKKFNSRVCLFVKDPKSDFKDLGLKSDFDFKLKVMSIEKLKQKYSRFQERRNLLKEYDTFLCDSKIYFLLKKLLGKPFYVSKKYPLPIKLDYSKKDEIKETIQNSINNSTVFHMTHGPNYTIKISRAVSSEEEILQNYLKVYFNSSNISINILKFKLFFDLNFHFIEE